MTLVEKKYMINLEQFASWLELVNNAGESPAPSPYINNETVNNACQQWDCNLQGAAAWG